MDKPIYCILYHDGNVCFYKDKECLSSRHYKYGHSLSIMTMLKDALDLMYRTLLKDEIVLFDINDNNEVQQRIDDICSLVK